MGKLDIEFHKRGYDLIHVPAGKDNADGRRIAVSSSIHEHYPNGKEVLVCSSDTIMTNLCNHLQKNRLIACRVCKQGSNLTILNSKNGQTHTISLNSVLKITSLEQFITQLKSIVIAEQARNSNQWIHLSKILQVYQENHNVSLKEIVWHHKLGESIADSFINRPSDFVHKLPEQDGIYVNCFALIAPNTVENNSDTQQSILKFNKTWRRHL